MTAHDTIDLDQFLKTCGVATGGQAKMKIQAGEVKVNQQVETRRRRKLKVGDEVAFDGEVYQVVFDDEDEDANDSHNAESALAEQVATDDLATDRATSSNEEFKPES